MRSLMMTLLLAACQASPPGGTPATAPPPDPEPVQAASADATEAADPGLVTVDSTHDVATTTDRLTAGAKKRGLTVFAVIDHEENATAADLELPPTRVVLLGNPKVGTKLMQCGATAALDLPQRILIHDDGGTTRITWNDPAWLAARHDLGDCGGVHDKIAGLLQGLAQAAGEGETGEASGEAAGGPSGGE